MRKLGMPSGSCATGPSLRRKSGCHDWIGLAWTSALAKTKAIEWLEAMRALVLESCVGILDLAESELGDQILWKGKPFGQSFRYTSKNARSSRASHDVL